MVLHQQVSPATRLVPVEFRSSAMVSRMPDPAAMRPALARLWQPGPFQQVCPRLVEQAMQITAEYLAIRSLTAPSTPRLSSCTWYCRCSPRGGFQPHPAPPTMGHSTVTRC